MSGREVYADPEHRGKAGRDYPRLSLKTNEQVRLYLIDINRDTKRPKFVMDFTHYIKGAWYYICVGDYETVLKDGLDPVCPACTEATGDQDDPIGVAKRRFACHVVRYHTDARHQLITPPSGEILAWVFGDDKFNKLINLSAEFDLVRRDLIVTCSDEGYQKMDFIASDTNRCMVLRPESQFTALRTAVSIAFKEQKLPDLGILLGNHVEKDRLEKVVNRARGAMRAPAGVEEAMADVPTDQAVAQLFDGIELGEPPAQEAVPSAEVTDALAEVVPSSVEPVAPTEPKSAEVAIAVPEGAEEPTPEPVERAVSTETPVGEPVKAEQPKPPVAGREVDIDDQINELLA